MGDENLQVIEIALTFGEISNVPGGWNSTYNNSTRGEQEALRHLHDHASSSLPLCRRFKGVLRCKDEMLFESVRIGNGE